MGAVGDQLDLAVVGAGYVGLVTAACLSMLGFFVRCIDRDEARIEGLQHGLMPFAEPGVADAIAQATAADRLKFSTSPLAAHGASAALICVGTLDERGEWTDRDVNSVFLDLTADGDAPRTLIVRSTVMPGTTARLAREACEMDSTVEVATNPEFLRQGSAIDDFMRPDRLVFGLTRPASESTALAILRAMYARIGATEVVTDAQSAELIKVGSNAFLGMKAGFANEMARLAAAAGADVSAVVDGIGKDARIGRAFMTPGPGFGGACLPSQSRALPEVARQLAVATPIIDAVNASNVAQAGWIADELERAIGGLAGKRVAVLGLTFKAGTGDVRESAALRLCRVLGERGATVIGHDPSADQVNVATAATVGAAVTGADAVVVATDWSEYAQINWATIAALMAGNTVFDTRNVVDRARVREAGLTLIVHGRVISDTD